MLPIADAVSPVNAFSKAFFAREAAASAFSFCRFFCPRYQMFPLLVFATAIAVG